MKTHTLFLSFLLFLGACSSPRYLSKPMEFKYHVKGLYFEATIDGEPQILGEIIEVNSKEIKILPVDNVGGMRTILKEKIQSGDIIVSLTSDNPKRIGTWAGLTNLATVGHGWFMIFTVPINLAVTIPIALDAAKGTYRIKYPDNILWNDISKFARFPQGIPENIDQYKIR